MGHKPSLLTKLGTHNQDKHLMLIPNLQEISSLAIDSNTYYLLLLYFY